MEHEKGREEKGERTRDGFQKEEIQGNVREEPADRRFTTGIRHQGKTSHWCQRLEKIAIGYSIVSLSIVETLNNST